MKTSSILGGIGVITAALLSGSAMAAESKGFVVSWFTDANYFGGDADCPKGLNPSAIDFYRRDLAVAGYAKDQIEEVLKEFPGEGSTQPWVPLVTTRGNKKDNIYLNPTSIRDPGLRTVEGKYSYGLNLDGREDTGNFIEPDTGEKGIDNQYYRILGCIRSYRGVPKPGHSNQSDNAWDVIRHQMPAWVVTITAANGFSADGPVTVEFSHAIEAVTLTFNGARPQPDMSYHIDPDPRTRNILHGTLVKGVVTTDSADVHMLADPFIMAEFRFAQARLRFSMLPDGSLDGYIGGYMPVDDIWYSFADGGHIKEYSASMDLPGIYYALHRLADADPDPKTGKNRRISSAYRIEATPAFVLPPDEGGTRTSRSQRASAK